MRTDRGMLPDILCPMAGRPSIETEVCAICGRPSPLNRHHIIRRSAGTAYDTEGNELAKPTVVLCGIGNNLRDAEGRYYCHGLAHHSMLHFRFVEGPHGHWEYLRTRVPMGYSRALGEPGWKVVGTWPQR